MTDSFSTYAVPSESDPSKSYTVTMTREGSTHCDCMAFRFSKKGARGCKHIRSILAQAMPVAA